MFQYMLWVGGGWGVVAYLGGPLKEAHLVWNLLRSALHDMKYETKRVTSHILHAALVNQFTDSLMNWTVVTCHFPCTFHCELCVYVVCTHIELFGNSIKYNVFMQNTRIQIEKKARWGDWSLIVGGEEKQEEEESSKISHKHIQPTSSWSTDRFIHLIWS